jgi:prolipoprotein diacylglyceryltransferase
MGTSRASVVAKKLEQGPTESKKALYAFVGGVTVLVILLAALILIHLHPEEAKEIIELVNTGILFYGATITMLITGQAAFDFKAVSVLQHLDEDEKIDSNAEAPDVEINQRVVKPRYFDDGSF